VREKYWQKLKRYKKEKTKIERADEHISDWLEELFSNASYNTLLSRDNILYSDYIKEHFITEEDKRNVMLHAVKIIQLIYDCDNLNISWQDLRKEVYKVYPEQEVKDVAAKIMEMKSQDIVMTWSITESW
jgi:predicted RNase H-like nuclease